MISRKLTQPDLPWPGFTDRWLAAPGALKVPRRRPRMGMSMPRPEASERPAAWARVGQLRPETGPAAADPGAAYAESRIAPLMMSEAELAASCHDLVKRWA